MSAPLQWTSRQVQRCGFACVLGFTALAYAYVFVGDFPYWIDNQAYLMLGRALAEGKGYVDYWTGEPIPHTHFPPGYPLFIALAMKLGVTSLLGLKVLNGSLFAVVVYAAWVWTSAVFEDRAFGLAAAAFVGLNATVVQFASFLMSETLFTGVGMVAVLCALRVEQKEGRVALAWTLLLGVVLCVGFYVRTAGLALGGGVVLGMAWSGRARLAAITGVTFAVGCTPWVVRGLMLPQATYFDYFVDERPGDGITAGVSEIASRLWVNLGGYAAGPFPDIVAPTFRSATSLHPAIGWTLSLLLVGLAVLGWSRMKRGREIVGGYLTVTALMLLMWPSVWTFGRFLIPVVPFVTVLALAGVRRVLEVLSGSGQPAPVTFLLPLIIFCLPAFEPAARYAANPIIIKYENFDLMAAAVEAHAGSRDRIATANPPGMHYLTGRQSTALRFDTDPARMLANLEEDRISFVVIANEVSRRFLSTVVQAYPERFELVASVPDGLEHLPPDEIMYFVLYRFDSTP